MATKRYSVEERAQALAVLQANGGNLKRTERDTGIPRKTLAGWRDGNNKDHAAVVEQLPAKCEDLASKLDEIAHKIVFVIPEKIEEAKLKDLTYSLGVIIDKRNLLRGQATSITETRSDTQRYETTIKTLMEQSAKNGEPVDREEAISLLEIHLPEIRQYVTPATEAVN